MTTLTRSLLILALAVALVAVAAFDPHDPEGQACPADDPRCHTPVVEMELAGTEIGNGDTAMLETMLACDANDPSCGPNDNPVLEMGLACDPNDPGCTPNDAPVVEAELAGTEIGNGDAPVPELV